MIKVTVPSTVIGTISNWTVVVCDDFGNTTVIVCNDSCPFILINEDEYHTYVWEVSDSSISVEEVIEDEESSPEDSKWSAILEGWGLSSAPTYDVTPKW